MLQAILTTVSPANVSGQSGTALMRNSTGAVRIPRSEHVHSGKSRYPEHPSGVA